MRLQELICSEVSFNWCVWYCEELICDNLHVFDPCQPNNRLAVSSGLGQDADGIEMLFSRLLDYTKSIWIRILLVHTSIEALSLPARPPPAIVGPAHDATAAALSLELF
jgi:hypothetical protein